jgi:hypothetical protein
MNRSKRIACLVAVVFALAAPSVFACDGCNNGGQVFSAPVYQQAPQILAAPVYAPQVFAAPVYQRQVFAAPVYQQRQVFASPAYAPQRAFVQKQVVVARAPRQPLFGFRGRSVQRNVVRGSAAAAVVY